MSYHVFVWDPEFEDEYGKMMGGELKHYIFENEYEVVTYINQMQVEMNNSPMTSAEFGLNKKRRYTVEDLLNEGYLFVVKGDDMMLVMDGGNQSVERLEKAE